MLEQEWSYTVAHHFIYMHVPIWKPLPPSSKPMLTLAFLALQDEEDMVYAFTLPILWKPSHSMTCFASLKSTLSPHKTCFVPADKPSWQPLRKYCFCTDAGYNGSGRHMLVGNNFEGCGWNKTAFRTSTENKKQRLDHQGLLRFLFVSTSPCHFDFVLCLCLITQVPNEVRAF